MNATKELFGLAVVGYLFLYTCSYTRFFISQRSNYETLFLSIISGSLNVFFGQIVFLQPFIEESLESIRTAITEFVILSKIFNSIFNSESDIIRLDYMAIAMLFAIILDICLWPFRFLIIKRMYKGDLIVVRLQEKLFRLQKKPKSELLVEIYTSSNSKYTGFVLNAPPMNRSRSGDVELLARSRGWVDGNTGNETTSADYYSLADSIVRKDGAQMKQIRDVADIKLLKTLLEEYKTKWKWALRFLRLLKWKWRLSRRLSKWGLRLSEWNVRLLERNMRLLERNMRLSKSSRWRMKWNERLSKWMLKWDLRLSEWMSKWDLRLSKEQGQETSGQFDIDITKDYDKLVEKEYDKLVEDEIMTNATRLLPLIIVPLAEIVAVKDAALEKRQPGAEENTKSTAHPPP